MSPDFAKVRAHDGPVLCACHFFMDEAHFRADVDLRAKWVLCGEPELVDTSSPKFGEKATYYSTVCLEIGEVASMPVLGNTNAQTTVAFRKQLRAKHPGR